MMYLGKDELGVVKLPRGYLTIELKNSNQEASGFETEGSQEIYANNTG